MNLYLPHIIAANPLLRLESDANAADARLRRSAVSARIQGIRACDFGAREARTPTEQL